MTETFVTPSGPEGTQEEPRDPTTLKPVQFGLARRYALAFYEYASERSALAEIMPQAEALRRLATSAPFSSFLSDRAVDPRAASKAADAVLAAQGFGDALRRFVGVIGENGRLSRLVEILDAFAALDAERRGEVIAEVRSAQPLSQAQRGALQARLAEAGYARIRLREVVAPELLGGLVVKIGALVFDSSLNGRLGRLQNAMKGAA